MHSKEGIKINASLEWGIFAYRCGIFDAYKEIGKMIIEPFLKFKDEALNKIPGIKQKLYNLSRFVVVPTLILKDKISDKLNKIKQRIDDINNKFRSFGSKVISPLITLKDKVSGPLQKVTSNLRSVKNTIISPLVNLKDKASAVAEKIKSKLRALHTSVSAPLIKARDQISGTLSKIKSSVLNLKNLMAGLVIGGAAAKGFESTIGGAMKLENQSISMEHFISKTNKGLNESQVKSMTDEFIKALRANANSTPFETGEVISAGARSVAIASGNTKEAMKLVKLAEDMAASSGGTKSISDAMEALADAKVGEMERLKEFGFKISADEFKSGGGFEGVYSKLDDFFGGASQKLATSGAGLWSTITGSLKSAFADMGKGGLDLLKPQLKELADLFSNDSFMNDFVSKGSEAVSKVIGAGIKLITWFKQNWPVISSTIKQVWGIIEPILRGIGEGIKWAFSHKELILGIIQVIGILVGTFYAIGTAMKIFNGIIAITTAIMNANPIVLAIYAIVAATALLYVAWKNNLGGIQQIVQKVMSFIAPYIQGALTFITNAFNSAVGFLSAIDWSGIFQKVMEIIEVVKPYFFQFVEIIKSIFLVIVNVIQTIIPIIQSAFGFIKQVIMDLWPFVSTVINGIIAAIGVVAPFIMNLIQTIISAISIVVAYIEQVIPLIIQVLSAIWTLIGPQIVNTLTFVWNMVQIAFNIIWTVISSVMTVVIDVIKTAWDFISGIFKGVLQILTGDISGGFQTIWDTIVTTLGNIGKTIWDFASGMFDVGKSIIEGIIDGVNAMWDSVVGVFKGLWSSIKGIFSKKVAVEVEGKNSGSGIDGSHKSGLGYVPFDGYIAELHKGEMVIPADIANSIRGTKSSTDIINSLRQSPVVPLGEKMMSSKTSLPTVMAPDNKPKKPDNPVNNPVNITVKEDYKDLKSANPEAVTNYNNNTQNTSKSVNSTDLSKKQIIIQSLISNVTCKDEADEDRLVEKIINKLADLIDEAAFNSGEVELA